ncbi:MAG TPA: ABC transporter permease [Bryobacteraceae bacterium]|nr:ABC transporter permease [Bryobacteraceae bacterium]
MLTDLRFTLRTFRRSPGFVLIAVLSLALGIGANTAVFSLFDQVLVRSLPVAAPDRLVLLHTEGQDLGWAAADNFESVFSYPMYRDLRARNRAFEGMAARSSASATVLEPSGAANAPVELVSGDFFQVLGVRAALGRTILPDDDTTPGAHPVAMLSYGYWTRRFGGDPKVLNSRLLVNGQPMTVIGIVEERFLGVKSGQVPELYIPLTMKQQISPGWDAFENVGGRWLNIIARLKPGVSLEAAQASTRVLFKAIRTGYIPKFRHMNPGERADYEHRSLDLVPAAQGINLLSHFYAEPLRILMVMVGLVLLIACANLASLLIARAAARRKEMALRAAVGAGRWALQRQQLVESLTLTLAAGFLGLLIAQWANAGLLRLISDDDGPRWLAAQLDLRLFAYAMAVAVAAGVLFGCAPLLQTLRIDLVTALKEQAGTTGSGARQRARKALVAAQISLALVLVSGAALFARTLMNLRNTNPGFEPASVLTFAVEPRLNGYDKPRTAALLRTLRERLAAIPGVESVTYAAGGPFTNFNMSGSLAIEGYRSAPREEPGASRDSVSSGYFHALRIPVLAGREFDARDNASSPKVAIINQAFANKYFRGRNPVGRHVGGDELENEVVGVVGNMRHDSLRETPEPFVYFVHEQAPPDRSYIYMRGYGRELAAAARAAVREVDSNLPLTDVKTLQARVDRSLFTERAVAVLAAAFGFLATVLAAVGLYGVVAYSVARRTVEIGIRMALGAQRRDVYRIVLGEMAVLVIAGVAAGLPVAFALGRLVESRLYGVRPGDPLLLAAAVASLALVALAAAYVPARRAAAVDPVRALHGE